MRNLNDCRLYGILDLSYVDRADAVVLTEAMIDGGVDCIQLRAKGEPLALIAQVAAEIHRVTLRSSVPLIVNDHVEVARQVAVEGVHVGQDDDAVRSIREKAVRPLLVGKSTHSLGQAKVAQSEGADYIGFGPIFATPTKPDYVPIGLNDIARVHQEVALPIFCIGGININNLEQVIDAGARRVVMVSALLKAPDIVEYARAAKGLLNGSQVSNSNL